MKNDMIQLVDNTYHLPTIYFSIFKQLNCTIKRALNLSCRSIGQRWSVVGEFCFI